jgi:GntR family transcriptional repressor for pyruvate dehydrogenase complex
MFSSISQDKISQTIIKQIREAIISGKLKPGDRLPPEKRLLAEFGVSRYTLRESLSSLESMGLIGIQKGAGGGPVVREVDMQVTREAIANFLYFQKPSIKDLSEVRKLIEPDLARTAATTLSAEDLQYLSSLNQACRDTLARGEEIIGGEHEIDFHIHLARKSGNPVLMMILDFVNKLLVELKLECKPGSEFSWDVIDAHDRILQALQSRNGDLAAQAMYEHVCQVEEEIGELELGARND